MNTSTVISRSRLVRAAVLSVVCSLAWLSPPPASAQLAPLPVSLPGAGTVSITSPPSGARAGGTVTVTANATAALGVTGVEFMVDGVPLGTQDTTAPYSVSWDTTAGGDGWHTLTAVARDALGMRYKSDPVTVTVSNTPPPPQAVRRFEESDPSVAYTPGWQSDASWPWSGGTMVQSRLPGARATFAFTGTSVTWIGFRSSYSGIARVSVDGVFVSDVDLFGRSGELRVPAFTMSGLTDSQHTLTIETTGLKNVDALDNVIVVDAFDVPGLPVSRLQDTDPAIAYTAGWTTEEGTRNWSNRFAALSSMPGAQATLTFNGTSIDWIGYRGPDGGIARVYLDGTFSREVDLYSPMEKVQDSVFTATGLADGSHTLTIEVTDLKNDASMGTLVVADAFDVTAPGTRFEDTDWSVAYAGHWNLRNQNHAWSQGITAVSNSIGSRATFTFIGTSVGWIGRRGPWDAIARVYLDGMFAADVDNYAPTEGIQDTLFTATGLPYGTHTLTIEVTGRKNPASTLEYPWVVVDGFDVRP